MWHHKGFSPAVAAGVISVTGIAAVVGRLGIGAMLDHRSMRLVGITVFLLPLLAALLLCRTGNRLPVTLAAAGIFGLANGTEKDMIAYITSRRLHPHCLMAMIAFAFLQSRRLEAAGGKKESGGGRYSRPHRSLDKPFSNSSCDNRPAEVLTAISPSPSPLRKICQSSASFRIAPY